MDLSDQEKERFKLLINYFGDTFGKTIEDIRSRSSYPPIALPVLSDYNPTRSRPFRCSPLAQTEINWQVEELLENGIIEESSSLQTSSAMLVRKANNTFRLVLNLRKVNLGLKPMSFPLISLEHVINRISSKKFVYLTQLNFLSGFSQIFVREQDRDISTFVTGDSSYRYSRLVFGLSSSPTLFSVAMSSIFRESLKTSALLYIDDILVMSENFENHLKDLEKNITSCKQFNLKLISSKCGFFKKEVTFLGYRVGCSELTIDPKKLSANAQMTSPKHIRELRFSLGLFNFFRGLICRYARITSVFHDLLIKSENDYL